MKGKSVREESFDAHAPICERNVFTKDRIHALEKAIRMLSEGRP